MAVRKGERSTLVVFWKLYDTADRRTGEPTRVPILRYYNEFNAGQCDGIAEPDTVGSAADFGPTEKAD